MDHGRFLIALDNLHTHFRNGCHQVFDLLVLVGWDGGVYLVIGEIAFFLSLGDEFLDLAAFEINQRCIVRFTVNRAGPDRQG